MVVDQILSSYVSCFSGTLIFLLLVKNGDKLYSRDILYEYRLYSPDYLYEMDKKEYLFFKNNLKRTVLSQSRYLCPRKRLQPATKTLYTSQSVPLLPGSCRDIIKNNSFQKSITSSEDDFKSSNSMITNTSRKSGTTKKSLTVTIPTGRPWSCYSDNSSFHSCTSSESKSWNVLSPVYITRHGAVSSGRHVTSSGRHVTSSGNMMTSSNSSTWGSFAEERLSGEMFVRESEGEKCMSEEFEECSETSGDSDQLTNVISGVCLLDSLDKMSNKGGRRKKTAGPINIVKSVLHRQMP